MGGTMLDWLRKKLRDWLLDADVEDKSKYESNILKCVIDGEDQTYSITETCGAYLRGVSELGERILCVGHSRDPEHFNAIWTRLNRDAVIEWVDEPSDKS
jgi:hypothetical protein